MKATSSVYERYELVESAAELVKNATDTFCLTNIKYRAKSIKELFMKTRKFAVSGILTIYIALSTLFMTGCEQPTNSPAPTLTGITAVYNGTAAIYPTTPLNNLKTDLTVTAAYSDGTTQTVTDYVLSGTLVVGASVVTVTYEGKTTTFNVTVTAAPSSDITYTATQSGGTDGVTDSTGIIFTFSESIDSLNLTAADITVGGTAVKDTAALTGSGTSWSLPVTVSAAGQATVEITKTGIEAGIKNVTVYKARQITPTLTGITAVYTGTATVYPSTPLDNLKTDLTVTAAYSNGTTQTVTDYALSGTLAVGTSTVTVNYEDKTTTFDITVTAAPINDITYTVIQTGGISDAATTTGIVFTFASSIDGMGISVTDITIGGTAEKGAAIFNGSGASWTLSPITVNSVGTATIKITKIGIEAGTKNVIVYKMPETFEFELNDEGTAYRVSKSPTTNGAVNIPASYNGLPVKFISNYAFSGCTGITSVIIPTGVTSIGEEAFKGCTNLGSITIPNTVTSIGRAAFYECTNLTTITLPNNITSIGSIDDDDGVFEKCTSLTEVIIPNSVTVIGVAAFGNCTNLTNITIPDSVKTIGDFAFYSCTGIASITIPAGVTSVGELVFYEWISSQTIYVRGRASQSAADTTWGSDWRDVCDAVIKYWNGSSYQ
jgi:hypothetical protein